MAAPSERDLRALRREQDALEKERQELLARVEKQRTRLISSQRKSEDEAQTEKAPTAPQVSTQQTQDVAQNAARPKDVIKEVSHQPLQPRTSENLREELHRWLDDSNGTLHEEAAEKAPSTNDSMEHLSVFSDGENTAGKDTVMTYDQTLRQHDDIKARMEELRSSLTESLNRTHGLRSNDGVSERDNAVGTSAKEQTHIQKGLVKSDHDKLSLKPYLIKKDDNVQRKIKLSGTEGTEKSRIVIEVKEKMPDPRFSHDEDIDRTDEDRLVDILARFKKEEEILDEENRRAAEEEAQRRQRLVHIQRQIADKEVERRRSQKLMWMQEESEKLEQRLKGKVQERIATEQRLRAIDEEESRLINILSSHQHEESFRGYHREIPLDIKIERDLDRQERRPAQIDERVTQQDHERNLTEAEAILNKRAEALDRKEAYLKRLELEIQSNLESTREKSIIKQDESTEEIHSIPREKSNTEATKADVTHLLKAYVNFLFGC